MCFPPSPVSDYDAHVFVRDPFTDDDRTRIWAMNERLHAIEGGDDMDVWYVTLEEATSRALPQTQLKPGFRDKSWALHRAHWYAGRFVLERGPDPREIVPEPTWEEIDEGLQGELRFIEEGLERSPAFGVLNLCRVLHSYTNGDVVVGKFQAAMWALASIDVDRHELIRSAIEAYRTKTYAIEGDIRGFFDEMSGHISRARELV